MIERLKFLKEHRLIYQRHKSLSQKELKTLPFKKESFLVSWMMEATKYEFVEVVDEITLANKYYWLIGRASVFRFPFNRVVLELKQEQDPKVIAVFKDASPQTNVIVNNICPACDYELIENQISCPDCGLFFQ